MIWWLLAISSTYLLCFPNQQRQHDFSILPAYLLLLVLLAGLLLLAMMLRVLVQLVQRILMLRVLVPLVQMILMQRMILLILLLMLLFSGLLLMAVFPTYLLSFPDLLGMATQKDLRPNPLTTQVTTTTKSLLLFAIPGSFR